MKANIVLISLMAILLGSISTVIKASQPVNTAQQEIYWKAIGLFESEDYSKALLYFKDLLEKDSANCELNYYVGMCYHQLEKTHLALIYFKVAAQESVYLLKIRILAQYNRENYDYGI